MSDKPMPHEEPVMGWKTEKAVLKARSGTVSGAGQSFLRGTLPGRRDSAASLFTPRSPIPPPPSYSAPPPPSTPAPPPPVSIAPSSSSKPAPAVPSLSQLEDSLAAAKLLTTAPPPPPRNNNNSNNFDDDDDDDSEPFLSPFTSPRSRPGEEDGESMLSPRSEDELTSPMKPRDNKSMSASSEKKFKRRAIQFVAYNWASTPNVHLDNAGPLSYGQPSPLGLARKGDSPIVSNTSRRDTDRAKAQSLPLTGSAPSSTSSSSSGGVTPLSPSVLTTAPLSLSASASSSSSSSSSDSTRVHSLDTKPINSIIGSCSPSNYQRPQTQQQQQQQQQQQNTVSLLRHTYITPSSPPVSPSQKTVSAEGFPESISKLKLRQSLLKKIQTVESQKASEGNKGLLKSPFASPSHTSSSSSHSSPSSSSQHKPPSSSMASILVLPIPPPSSSSSSSSPPDSDSSFAPRLLEAVDRQPSTVGDANQLPIKITQNSFFTCTESPPQGSETNKHIHNFLLSIGDARLRSAITEAVFPPKRQYRVTRSSLPVVVPNTDAKSNLPGAESPSPSDGSTPPSSINSSSSSGPSSVEEDDLASLELLLSQMEEDDDKDLVMMPGENGIPIIKSGSVDKLIERLTYEKFPDQDYLSAFLLTYRSFTTPAYVLKKMIERFHLLDTPDLPSSSPQFVKFFNERKRKPIQIRTCNAIKRWVENYWYDFHSDEDLITQLLSWVQGPLLHRSDGAYINLALIIEKTITKKVSGESSARKIVQEPIPPVYRPKPSDALLDCDPEEIARQLSMLEFEVYANIEPKECLNQSYNKDNRDVTSPNIVLMINRTNAIYKWVATAILQRPKLKPRVRALRTFILVAKELMKINNFNGVMEILSGMAAASVFRLHKTWDALDKKVQEMYDEMVTLMDTAHNSKTYRKMLKNCNPPCLPYIGRYLTDLTFTEDGHQTIQDNMVNFVKCRQLAVVIRQIQQYQQLPYNFTVVPEIYQALVQITNVEFPSEEELYRTSLEVEPREPKPPLS